MFVNHEKDIKHKLCDKGLVFCSHCCLSVVLLMRQHADWYMPKI